MSAKPGTPASLAATGVAFIGSGLALAAVGIFLLGSVAMTAAGAGVLGVGSVYLLRGAWRLG